MSRFNAGNGPFGYVDENEGWINETLHKRGANPGEWIPYTTEELSALIIADREILHKLQELVDEHVRWKWM